MWIRIADTGLSLLIFTHLTFNHRLLSTIVDAPEPPWHAGAGDEVRTGEDDLNLGLRLTASGQAVGSRKLQQTSVSN